jgi:hypothetical protein
VLAQGGKVEQLRAAQEMDILGGRVLGDLLRQQFQEKEITTLIVASL